MPERPVFLSTLGKRLSPFIQWFDSEYKAHSRAASELSDKVQLTRILPFIGLHLACLGVFFVGWSWVAVVTALALYFIRMFAITGFYHRYFSHRTFQTSRAAQFVFALLGASAAQRGPLWWAGHHRHHHRHSDDEEDVHSPLQRGFWWAHVGWITSAKNFPTDYSRVRDLAKYPELVFLNRFDTLVPTVLALLLFGFGWLLGYVKPEWGTSGWQMLVWGFFISTTILFHATASINSLAHLIGKRPFQTTDFSRNSFILALITLGEGWHNNHHKFMTTMRQGIRWWEIDITFYILKLLSWTGVIWGTR
ncbi:MAG: acyl-CoA desaturase [Blastocatellia bacterium]|nr:acyl-CoA desaturase [Blastocatellia bacterium]